MSAVNCGCDPEENDYKCERHRKMSVHVKCEGCGLDYNPLNDNDVNRHSYCSGNRCPRVEMSLNDYQRALHTYKDRHHECHALGIVGELAEVLSETVAVTVAAGNIADMVKKATAHGVALDPEKLKKELGDVLWYITAVASDNKLTMDDIAKANIAKLQARYPQGFVKGGGVRDEASHNVVRHNPLLSEVAAASVNLRTEVEKPLFEDVPPGGNLSKLTHSVSFGCGCRETTETDGTRQRTYCPDGNCRRLAR